MEINVPVSKVYVNEAVSGYQEIVAQADSIIKQTACIERESVHRI
jgi:hypothetical protein